MLCWLYYIDNNLMKNHLSQMVLSESTYSKSRVCIWMEDRERAHCTGKDTHGVSIMRH
jgi:hypothetical protein